MIAVGLSEYMEPKMHPLDVLSSCKATANRTSSVQQLVCSFHGAKNQDRLTCDCYPYDVTYTHVL